MDGNLVETVSEAPGDSGPVFLENHDQARSLPRWGSKKPEYRSQSGKLLAFLISTLSGTLFLYQGQEIGMSDIPRDWPLSELKDNWWLSYIAEEAKKHPGDEAAKQKAIEAFYIGGMMFRIMDFHGGSINYRFQGVVGVW